MNVQCLLIRTVAALASTFAVVAAEPMQGQKVQVPQPGVPELMRIEGEFIRIAYNNEGYVVLGYNIAQQSINEPWMMLEVGATMRQGRPNYKLERSSISLDTPDGQKLALATNEEYRGANLVALQRRAQVYHESIDYFPPGTGQACRLGFFADVGSTRAFDVVELSPLRACVGALYFNVPGGIQYGQYWLNVKFPDNLVRVPFRILTAEERKTLQKNYSDIRKQVEEAFKPKK